MRRLSLLLVALLLGGCRTFADPTSGSPAPTSFNRRNWTWKTKVQPQTLWSRDIGAGSDELSLNLDPRCVAIPSMSWMPRVGPGARRQDGIRRVAGRTDVPANRWSRCRRGLVLIGTSEAEVIALAVDSGTERWRTHLCPARCCPVPVAVTVSSSHIPSTANCLAWGDQRNERWRYEREVLCADPAR